MFETPQTKVYSVSEINSSIKQLLETRFFDLSLEGEISNFRPSSAGHWYFSLKDRDSMISAVMFRRQAAMAGFIPADGQKVIIKGRLSVYPQRGQYQIICESIEPAGEGDILAMLEKRKRELAARGLFDSDKKKLLPRFPRRLCVISSPTSAALQDILKITGRLAPSLDILILPCAVQGDEAGKQIIFQLEQANKHQYGDIIILARGGGSLEDLLPFSETAVVEAVASSTIPVITGVGHEIDFSLVDFASDVRAATPSAAAERAVAGLNEIERAINDFKENSTQQLKRRIENSRTRLERYSRSEWQKLISYYWEPLFLKTDDLREKMINRFREKIIDYRHKIDLEKGLLLAASPDNIFKRGYSYVFRKDQNTPVTDSHLLQSGDLLGIRFARGTALTEVKETHE